MTKPPKDDEKETGERVPFDDALRQILKAPPAHKVAAKKPPTKDKKKTR